MPKIKVTRTYLEMKSPRQLRAAFVERPDLQILPLERSVASFYRYLYREVGQRWVWTDRTNWTDAQILELLNHPALSIFVPYLGGAPAGFVEMERQPEEVQIRYFGLTPECIGQGLGRHFLSWSVQQAWHMGPQRVWLHTCTLDGPAALPNYRSRGFVPYREEHYMLEVQADVAGRL
ncbi:MAG: GNAT family N-acetyltransferase [Candidatus Xenobia bacterium]